MTTILSSTEDSTQEKKEQTGFYLAKIEYEITIIAELAQQIYKKERQEIFESLH